MILRPDEMQLSRGESVRDTALVLSRHVDAVGVRTGPGRAARGAGRRGHDPGLQHAHRRPPPVPGAGRPAHAARGVRRASRGSSWPTSATATTSRARSSCSAAIAGVEVVVASPRRLRARAASTTRRPIRREAVARRPRRLHRRVGLDGRRGDGRRAPRRAGALPDRRRAARPRRARRHRPALPARPPRRGDHRGGPLRRRASASGTRPRTAATPRRRCSSGCSLRRHRADVHRDARHRPAHRRADLGGARRRAHGASTSARAPAATSRPTATSPRSSRRR